MRAKQLLKNFIVQNTWRYVIGILTLVVCTVTASFLPKILGSIMDGLNSGGSNIEKVYNQVLLMILLTITVFILKYIWRYYLIGNCRTVEIYLRDKLFEHLQKLPVSFYNQHKTGDLIAHAINDIQAIRITFGFGFVSIVEGVLISLVSVIFMVRTIHPILTIMALAPVPVAVWIMMRLRSAICSRFDKVQAAFSDISDKVQESISGIRVIKAFSQENEVVDEFITHSRSRVDTHMNLVKVSGLLGPAVQVCFGLSFMVFIIWGSELVVNGTITLGEYVAFNSFMLLIIGPVSSIARIIEVWQKGLASLNRLEVIFGAPVAIPQQETKDEASEIRGKIQIKNLNYSYPGAHKKTLKNINLTIQGGKTLGIIGKTGSGKTTLVNILLRLHSIGEGHVYIDDIDLNDINVDVLRECIGYVPQEHFLFTTTIRGNIEFFKPGYSEDDVEQAAKMSGVYDNIKEFPEGFETVVGERGVTLSGGQKQRISIARALIKDPSILILDDSLSAVDSKTEELILNNIKDILHNRTGIIISHRVSTVKNADIIIFMENGKIVEQGSHELLIALKGKYYNLYVSQTEENPTNQVAWASSMPGRMGEQQAVLATSRQHTTSQASANVPFSQSENSEQGRNQSDE